MREPLAVGMAGIRILSAATEFTAALLMLRSGRVETALRINGFLGLVGPAILVTTTALGIAGLAGKIAWAKVGLICAGVYLILYGSR